MYRNESYRSKFSESTRPRSWRHWNTHTSGYRRCWRRLCISFCSRHLGRVEPRVESTRSNLEELSLHMVRSSSVLKYSSAWRFTFMRDRRLRESKSRASRDRFNDLYVTLERIWDFSSLGLSRNKRNRIDHLILKMRTIWL